MNVMSPDTIVILEDMYRDTSITIKILRSIDLELEQTKYNDSLLSESGYLSCYDYQCNYRIKKENEISTSCPHCGRKLRAEYSSDPTLYGFYQHLILGGLAEEYKEIKHYNTYYYE